MLIQYPDIEPSEEYVDRDDVKRLNTRSSAKKIGTSKMHRGCSGCIVGDAVLPGLDLLSN